jgi:hypothetical protein
MRHTTTPHPHTLSSPKTTVNIDHLGPVDDPDTEVSHYRQIAANPPVFNPGLDSKTGFGPGKPAGSKEKARSPYRDELRWDYRE